MNHEVKFEAKSSVIGGKKHLLLTKPLNTAQMYTAYEDTRTRDEIQQLIGLKNYS